MTLYLTPAEDMKTYQAERNKIAELMVSRPIYSTILSKR